MNTAIVMFAKAPVPGKVKTRLANHIGEKPAASLHAAFIKDLVDTATSTGFDCYLAYSPDPEHEGFDCAREAGFTFIGQGEGDLSQRLKHVTNALFEQGHAKVIVIGSDSPTISTSMLHGLAAALDTHDVALGPAFDGGYWAIALSQPAPQVFEDITWSSSKVAAETVLRSREHALSLHFGPWWYDVDEIEDLRRLHFHLPQILCNDAKHTCPNTMFVLQALHLEGQIAPD